MANWGKGSARAYRRQEEYQRLEEIDAHRLWSSGYGLLYIAGRADTTPWFVRRWLREVANRATSPAAQPPADHAIM
jgi:hypothetical protein